VNGKIARNTLERWAKFEIPEEVVKQAVKEQEREEEEKKEFDVGGERDLYDEQERMESEIMTTHDLRVMTFNVCGLSHEKIHEMVKVTSSFRPGVVCLQETHIKDEDDANTLRRALRGYAVFIPEYRGRTRGVAIAIRSSIISPQPGPGESLREGKDGCSMTI
jgi:hypothetical protein